MLLILFDMNFDLVDYGECTTCTTENLKKRLVKDKLCVLNINIRSLSSNFITLLGFLNDLNTPVDIIVVTESWLNDSNANLFNIPGYKSIYVNRNHMGGGICVFYRQDLKIEKLDSNSGIYDSHESLTFFIYFNNIKITIMCV